MRTANCCCSRVTSRGGDEALPALEAVGDDDFAVAEHRALRGLILRRLRDEPPAEGDDALALEYDPALDALRRPARPGTPAVVRELSLRSCARTRWKHVWNRSSESSLPPT